MQQFTLYDILFLFIACVIGAVFRIIYDSATTHLQWSTVIKKRLLPIALYVCVMVLLNGKIKTQYINLDLSNTQVLLSVSVIAGMFISDVVNTLLYIVTYKDLPAIIFNIILSKFGYVRKEEDKNDENNTPVS